MDKREPHIIFDNVSYCYPNIYGRPVHFALKNINLTIYKGEFVAVLGENGAGKSTFCQALNGIVPQSRGGQMSGRVMVGGLDTQAVTVATLSEKVGIVLEDPETQLFTTSVLSEVAFGPENLGVDPQEILRRAKWALEVVRLTGYEHRAPSTLSGGQKQRLAIAAALTMQPEILALDEATSQLDPMGTVEVFSVVRELNKRYGMTIVMASDKGEEVAQFADRVLVLHKGELIAQGTPREVFSDTVLLKRIMIRSPQVSQLATYLCQHNVSLAEFPTTLEEAKCGIENLLGWNDHYHERND